MNCLRDKKKDNKNFSLQNLKKCFVQVISYWEFKISYWEFKDYTNSVDLDKVAYYEPPYQILLNFQNQLFLSLALLNC